LTWGHGTTEDGSQPVCNGRGGVLIRTNQVGVADPNCAHGGIEIEIGMDTSGEGVLNDIEVDPDLTQYACNGAPGETGPQGLQGLQGVQGMNGQNGVDGSDGDDGDDGADGSDAASRVVLLEVGSDECAGGGVLIETGIDENGNGVLNNNEVDGSQKICNGANGSSQAFSFEPIAKDKECGANTGVRILSGLDDGEGNSTANNNVLEADEVDARRALCVTGANLTIKDSSGCSVAQGAGARPHKHTTLWLSGVGALWVLGLAGVIMRRRRTRN
jgi:MYXO-CTERM domain-containing protein